MTNTPTTTPPGSQTVYLSICTQDELIGTNDFTINVYADTQTNSFGANPVSGGVTAAVTIEFDYETAFLGTVTDVQLTIPLNGVTAFLTVESNEGDTMVSISNVTVSPSSGPGQTYLYDTYTLSQTCI